MNKEPSVLLLEHYLKALKLPTFLRSYAAVGVVCGQERADYPTYLLRLPITLDTRGGCKRLRNNVGSF